MSENQPIVDEIIEKIKNKLIVAKWYEHLWTFVSGPDMYRIVEYLVSLKEQGKYFVPSLPDTFTSMRLCRPDKVKCIIITSLKGSNVDLTEKWKLPMSPSTEALRKVLDTINREYVNVYDWSSNQGVLQISTAVTSVLNGDHHYDLWKSYIGYLINKLNELYPEVPYIFVGKGANQYIPMVKSRYKYTVQTWPWIYHNNAWSKVNELLVSRGVKEIEWWKKPYKVKGTMSKKEAENRTYDRYYKKHPQQEPEWRKVKRLKEKEEED